MGESPQTAPTQSPADDLEPLICPNCGYDLRQSPGERCSECGQAIDRSIVRASNFPWAHRRHLGRIAALCTTVWLVSINSKRLRFEISKTQLLADGRAFRKWIAAIVATALISIAITLVASYHGLDRLGVKPISRLSNINARGGATGWFQDLAVPWSAGATMIPTWPLMLTFLAIHLTGIPQRLFKLKTASPKIQERAAAIGCYSIAPLAWLLPLFALWGPLYYEVSHHTLEARWLTLWLAASPWLALLIALLTMMRVVQWSLRVRYGGPEHALVAIPSLLGLWLLALLLFLGIFPWCIGFVWLVIDSLQ
jgi:hypothetical protein